MSDITHDEIKEALEEDLWKYASYVLPHYAFGDIHKEVLRKMGSGDREANQLYLLPRDHLKSVCLAVYCTWRIAVNPAYTILYITADEGLGRLQMSFMQQIFESDRFRTVWPDHFLPEVGRRKQWTSLAVQSDHPRRVELKIRDETIAVKTIKSGKTGRHPDEICYDDLVVPENAYTEIGRREVRAGAAQAVSLTKNSNPRMTAVGTIYHPKDQYSIWQEATYQEYDNKGEYITESPLWWIMEKKVEDKGDLTGNYLWPRSYSPETKDWYGWSIKTLARKKAEYISNGEAAQFYAQYYMQANDPSSNRLSYDSFQYLNPQYLLFGPSGKWEYQGKRLSILATMDTAATDAASVNSRSADFTAIAVMGIDEDGFYYVLDLVQFQTDKRIVYSEELVRLWKKWGFREVQVELETSGKIVAEGIKDYMRENGYSLLVKGQPAARNMSKFERHASLTLPRYEQEIVFHTKGGWTAELEDQIVQERPAHDDLLDVVTMGISHLKQPMKTGRIGSRGVNNNVVAINSRFGGRRA